MSRTPFVWLARSARLLDASRTPRSESGFTAADLGYVSSRGGHSVVWEYITYESLEEGRVARVTLNRPEARNAQSRGLLVELGEAFSQAEADDEVRVVILAGAGPMF